VDLWASSGCARGRTMDAVKNLGCCVSAGELVSLCAACRLSRALGELDLAGK